MRLTQVIARLHFGQSAHETLVERSVEIRLKLVTLFVSAHDELLGPRGSGHDQFDAAIIKFINQPYEAPELIGITLSEARHVRDQNRVIAARELDVVRLTARPIAELREIEPRQDRKSVV